MSDNYTEAQLQAYDFKELRSIASNTFRIVVTKDMTKEILIGQILAKEAASNSRYAKSGEGAVRPGYARIRIEKQNSDNGSSEGKAPVLAGINGYQLLIPRGKEVDVPIKFYNHLMSLKRKQYEPKEGAEWNDAAFASEEEVARFPVTLLAINDSGEDEFLTPWERVRESKLAPYREFYARYSYWPKTDEVKEYMRAKINSQISLPAA